MGNLQTRPTRRRLRKRCRVLVLPKHGRHPQMIFAYLTIREIITHVEAFWRPELLSKRMGNKTPNGNIIVDARGEYNKFDAGVHFANFDRIKRRYAIGESAQSRLLSSRKIQRLAPSFIRQLSRVIGKQGTSAVDIISRKGRKLTLNQVQALSEWLTFSA